MKNLEKGFQVIVDSVNDSVKNIISELPDEAKEVLELIHSSKDGIKLGDIVCADIMETSKLTKMIKSFEVLEIVQKEKKKNNVLIIKQGKYFTFLINCIFEK